MHGYFWQFRQVDWKMQRTVQSPSISDFAHGAATTWSRKRSRDCSREIESSRHRRNDRNSLRRWHQSSQRLEQATHRPSYAQTHPKLQRESKSRHRAPQPLEVTSNPPSQSPRQSPVSTPYSPNVNFAPSACRVVSKPGKLSAVTSEP